MAATSVEPVSPGMPRGCEQQVFVHISESILAENKGGIIRDVIRGRDTRECDLLAGTLLQK